MNTWVTVARYHLVRPVNYLALALIIPLAFALDAVTAPRNHDPGAYLPGIFIAVVILGWQAISRSLPFCLTLGASRRSFYSGTVLLGMTLALVSGLVVTVLQAIERATDGWGLSVHFFRVPRFLNGPWYLTLLTSAVVLFALFAYGMWHGVVHHRWGLLGTLAFIAVQVAAVVIAAMFWHGNGHVRSAAGGTFAGLSALGLTGVVAALAVLLLAGGHATIRRATV